MGVDPYWLGKKTPSRFPCDAHPPPCGMDRKQAQARLDRIRDTPARNWRERRQKARVIAASYRRRKPLPVWDGVF